MVLQRARRNQGEQQRVKRLVKIKKKKTDLLKLYKSSLVDDNLGETQEFDDYDLDDDYAQQQLMVKDMVEPVAVESKEG